MEKTHWKKQFNYDYLGSYSLQDGKDVTLTMAETRKEKITGKSGKKEEAFVCYFKEKADWIKPMILNRTNCKTIEKIYDTPYIEEWTGKQITIFIQKGVAAFGDTVDALRIRKQKPPKPTLTKDHPSYAAVCKHIKEAGDITTVTNKFVVSDELLKEIQNG